MELDLIDVKIDLKRTTPREIEEAMEDPFALRFIPDLEGAGGETRYFLIGKTVAQRFLLICFNADGKKAKPIACRECSEPEQMFYERNYASYQ